MKDKHPFSEKQKKIIWEDRHLRGFSWTQLCLKYKRSVNGLRQLLERYELNQLRERYNKELESKDLQADPIQ
jgi:hypothetical protein